MEEINNLEDFECMMKERYEKLSKWEYAIIMNLVAMTDKDGTPINKYLKKKICSMRALALDHENLTVTCKKVSDYEYDYSMVFWYKTMEEKDNARSEVLPYLSIATQKHEGFLRKGLLSGDADKSDGSGIDVGGKCPTGGNWCD